MKPRIRRRARLLVALSAAATAVLTAASAAAAAAPVDPYRPYVTQGRLSFVEQPGVRVSRDMIMDQVAGTNGGMFARSGRPVIGNISWNRRSISLWTTSPKVWNNYHMHTGGLPATPRRALDFSGDGVADLVGVTLGAQYTANAVLPTPSVPNTTAIMTVLGSRSALVRPRSEWSSSGCRPLKPHTSNGYARSNGNTFETSMTWWLMVVHEALFQNCQFMPTATSLARMMATTLAVELPERLWAATRAQ